MVARQLAAQLLHEPGLVGAERHPREPEDQVGDVVGAVLRDCEQQERQVTARVVVQPSEQAEVDEREPTVRRQQDVPAVGIGVVDALHRHLVHICTEELPRELMRALGAEAVLGVDLAPFDPLEDESPLRHVRPDHGRHDEVLVPGDDPRDQLGVVRFLDEVELRAQMHLELIGQRARLQELRPLGPRLEQFGRRAHQREVDVDLLLDAGAAHLDDHVAAVRKQCRVDLSDRRRRERLGVDAHEDVWRQFLRDHLADLLERDRRDLVDELAELLDVNVRQEIRPRRQELPELDVGRPELFERPAELARAVARRGPVAPHAELAQHAQQAATARDTSDVDSTLEPLRTRAHQPAYLPRVRLGNARASLADARGSRRRLRGAHATRVRRERHRAGRRGSGAGPSPDGRRAGRRRHVR